MVTKQDGHVLNSAVLSMISLLHLFFFVILYNFTKGHIISLPRCALLLFSIISFSVINSVFVINAKCRKLIKYKYKYWLSCERTGVDRISRRIESKGNGLTKL